MNLILLEPGEVSAERTATLRDGRARHAIEVLGVRPGHPLRVGIVNGAIGTGTVIGVGEGSVQIACVLEQRPPRPRVDLLLALPRPKVLRRLWAQLAALGVGQIILTNAERVERHYFDTHVLTEACYRPLLIEGLQQARDTWLPAVSVHKQFRVLIEDELVTLASAARRLVAHPDAHHQSVELNTTASERVLLAVGPEGGWNDFELTLLAAHGFERFDMGLRTLRSDTACIAALAIVNERLRGGT